MVGLGILIFVAWTSLLVLVTTKHVTIGNNWDWYAESVLEQGICRDDIKVFLWKLMIKRCKADKNLIQKLATVFLMKGGGKIRIKKGEKGQNGRAK